MRVFGYGGVAAAWIVALSGVCLLSCSAKSAAKIACVTAFDCPVDQLCGDEGWCVDPSEVGDVDRSDGDEQADLSGDTEFDTADEDIADEQVDQSDQGMDGDTAIADDPLPDDASDDDALLSDDDGPVSPCGNGVLDTGEECDDGNQNNEDACRNDCRFNVCGDGALLRAAGAVLILPLNEGSGETATDFSGNGNHGAVSGALWDGGRFGTGLSFAGAGAVTIPESDSLDMGMALTVAAWVRIPTLPAGFVGVIQKDGDAVRNYGLFIAGTDNPGYEGRALLSLTSAIPHDWRGVYSAASIVDGGWHHILATYDGAFMKMYVDGVEQGSVAMDLMPAQTDGGVFVGTGLSGWIDDVRVYDRVIDGVEIAELANGRIRLHFDETEGTATRDGSGNGHTGSFIGADRVAGRYGGGLSFNGAAGQLTVPHGPWLDLGAGMTLSLWLKSGVIPTAWVRVLGKSDISCANRNYGIWIEHDSGKVLFQIEGAAWLHLLSDVAVTDDQWHRIDATYDGAYARLYVDGTPAGELPYAQIPVLSGGPLTIGGGCGNAPMNGAVDEVIIYSRAFSADELALLPRYRHELCDDGNVADGDGCSAVCTVEPLP